jgi:hypothetical protein
MRVRLAAHVERRTICFVLDCREVWAVLQIEMFDFLMLDERKAEESQLNTFTFNYGIFTAV